MSRRLPNTRCCESSPSRHGQEALGLVAPWILSTPRPAPDHADATPHRPLLATMQLRVEGTTPWVVTGDRTRHWRVRHFFRQTPWRHRLLDSTTFGNKLNCLVSLNTPQTRRTCVDRVTSTMLPEMLGGQWHHIRRLDFPGCFVQSRSWRRT